MGSPPTFRVGAVRADCVYTKAELARALSMSIETLDACLDELEITAFRAGKRSPQISGQVYLERVSAINRGGQPSCASS